MVVIFRADASSKMGTGHLMRCLALAQCCADHGVGVTFVTACDNPVLLQRLSGEGFHVVRIKRPYPDSSDWDTTEAVLQKNPGAWVVMDGYHFDTAYQYQIHSMGSRCAVIDDYGHAKEYWADIIVNQNLGADEQWYEKRRSETKLMLGPTYALLRREFRSVHQNHREVPAVASQILITVGGGDPDNVSSVVLDTVLDMEIPGLCVDLVVGAANPHLESLRKQAHGHGPRVSLHVAPGNMAELMRRADLCISGAGSTIWELMFMGVPSILVVVADNQRLAANALQKSSAAMTLDVEKYRSSKILFGTVFELAHDNIRRRDMAQKGMDLVDGYGAQRVLHSIKEISDVQEERLFTSGPGQRRP